MAVSIDTSSIEIDIHADGMRPLVKIVNRPLKIGNTSFPGSAIFYIGNEEEKALVAAPITSDARVRFSMEPGDKLNDWKVGFVQIVRQTAFRTRYT